VENLKKLTKCQQRYGAEKINGLPQHIAGKTQKTLRTARNLVGGLMIHVYLLYFTVKIRLPEGM
jgi:hypothetical protein